MDNQGDAPQNRLANWGSEGAGVVVLFVLHDPHSFGDHRGLVDRVVAMHT